MKKIKQAVVALIIKDGLILGITRRHDKTKFGLIGGKVEQNETIEQALLREIKEECNLIAKEFVLIYERLEPGDGPNGIDFYSKCYYISDWIGEAITSEEGLVKWITAAQLTSKDSAAFGDYNRKTLDVFKHLFPNVYIKGETQND